jgi:mRNA interferase RelE/StbE
VNTINWKPKALKQMRKLPTQAGAAIRKSVNTELIDLSAARNVKALANHLYGYRLRVGDYRVFFEFEGGDVCIVSIEEVRKRDERTY